MAGTVQNSDAQTGYGQIKDKNPPSSVPSSVFSDNDFLLWRDLIRRQIGIQIDESRKEFLKRRLTVRMMQLSLRSFGAYYQYVTNEKRRHDEWQELTELVVNNQSGFFRHLPSFEALMTCVFPELVTMSGLLYPVSIWSVGSSRGQEAYSLSMAFSHTFDDRTDLSYAVVGADISLNAIRRARSGEYSYLEVMDMPELFRKKYMTSFSEACSGKIPDAESDNLLMSKHRKRYRVKDAVRSRVRFVQKNIMNGNHRSEEEFLLYDVIFCQNVLIYLSISDRVKVISALLNRLNTDGYIFFAPGETVGIKIIAGALPMRFKDTLSFKRNKEAVHVQIIQ